MYVHDQGELNSNDPNVLRWSYAKNVNSFFAHICSSVLPSSIQSLSLTEPDLCNWYNPRADCLTPRAEFHWQYNI